MMEAKSLFSLPTEILDEICSFLGPRSFLDLAATCKAARINRDNDWLYWSTLVQRTFRVPNRPVVEQDGRRWRLLYRRLQTDTRAYTWGQNTSGCLGHSFQHMPVHITSPPQLGSRDFHHLRWRAINSGKPMPIEHIDDIVGSIVDLQCGAWSTVMLSSKGELYLVGDISRKSHISNSPQHPQNLAYPAGFARPSIRHEPATAVRQFSAGRRHVLALTDSGRVWSWKVHTQPAMTVKFIHHTTVEYRSAPTPGVVKRVVAGWGHSAALIEGTGIVLWRPCGRAQDASALADLALVDETAVIPKTQFSISNNSRAKRKGTTHEDDPNTTVGEVSKFIVLEELVIFCTHVGKLFAAELIWNRGQHRVAEPVQIPSTGSVKDIQGSHRMFGVLLDSGAALVGRQETIMQFIRSNGTQRSENLFTVIPALQNQDVIQLAFGGWHFHALHSDGSVTSYGKEIVGSRALGLHHGGMQHLRGTTSVQGTSTIGLLRHAYLTGRTVWFDEARQGWMLEWANRKWDEESQERRDRCFASANDNIRGELSEWVEQEARDWEHKYGVCTDEDDGLPAYFTLGIAAAGLHSGALVVVNQDLAQRVDRAVRSKSKDKDLFPRLVLDGVEMPGRIPFTPWRYGKPDFSQVPEFEL